MASSLENELIKEICSSGDKTTTIPATTQSGSNSLSYADGFPVATATPQSDGGIPPKRTDMNKVLNLLSKNLVFIQNGGSIQYDSDIATGIGGYPKGARLLFHNDKAKINIESLLDNNTTAPTNANIYYANKIISVEGVLSSGENPPTATADTVGKIYLIKAVVTYTPYAVTQCYIGMYNGGNYGWSTFNLSDLFDTDTTLYSKATKEYLAFYNSTAMTVLGYSDLSTYKWLYVNTSSTPTIIKTYRGGASWYRIWSDGFKEQGGVIDNGSDVRSLDKTVEFLVPYSDTNYIFNFTATRSGTSDHCVGAVGTKSKTSSSIIVAYYGNGSSELARYIMWKAEGY